MNAFQQAIDRDPNYALGYVGLADCYVLLEYYVGVPPSETLPKARAAIDRALQIDDSLAEAHASSGSAQPRQSVIIKRPTRYRVGVLTSL